MGRFRIELAPAAARDLDDLEMRMATKIISDLKLLEENPFPKGKLIKKLKGKPASFYRLRVDKFRVFYEIKGMNITVLRVVGKKEADRFIKGL